MNQERKVRWYFEPFKKYSQFSGRARRKEFWYFTLFNSGVTFILGFCEGVLGMANETQFSILAGIYSLAVLVPSIAVTVRRLHDTNRSGWWCFLAALPIVGSIALLVFMAQDGTPGSNRFGPNPKVTPPATAYGMPPSQATPPVRSNAA